MERQKDRTEMMKVVHIILLFTVVSLSSGQEANTYDRRLYNAYIRDEMDQWKGIISEMRLDLDRTENQELLYELCFAYYGYIGYLISEEDNKTAKKELKDALEYSEDLEEQLAGGPDVLALRGALLGYRIILSKFSSMYLGPRALKYISTAYDSDPECFNCNTEMGNMKFYTPGFLGGSKTEAIRYYEQGVEILETSQLKKDRSWIYINTVLLLANAYRETGKMDQACEFYRRLMEYEPEADWIRRELYSKCEQE